MVNKLDFPTDRTPIALGKKYLTERGITQDSIIERCGIEFASRQTCLDRIGSTRRTHYAAGIIIPYTDTYSVVRWLGDNVSQWGTKLDDDPKLLAPIGTPRVYIPPLIDWNTFTGVVYICESALKAVVLAQHGYCAIAGNGVDGIFTNSGFSLDFPHALFESGKVETVKILYDSDWATNVQVQAAIRRQATGISNRYPTVTVIHKALDHGDNKKWGIDDAVAKNGVEWLHTWMLEDTNEHDIEVSPLQKHFDELNERYVVCNHPVGIIKQSTGILYSRGNFTDLLEAKRTYMERRAKNMVKVSPAKEWIEWEGMTHVDQLVYNPGQTRLTATEYNSWKDDGVTPFECTAEDIEPFLRVYKNAIPDTEAFDIMIESMAWMLQNRGTKLDKTFLFIGSQVGTGKSLLAQTYGKLVGRSNFSSIGVEDFIGDFNSAFTAKEAVLVDDLYKIPKPAMGKLKRYITDETIMVNPKGVQAYEIDNHAVFFITSNNMTSLPMDSNERRVVTVHFEPTIHYPTGTAWWNEYHAWLWDGGYEKLRYWLEHLDVTNYDPNFMPPMNDIKRRITGATKTPEEEFVQDLMVNADIVLGGNGRACYTPKELWILFTGSGEDPTRSELVVLGQALSNSGFWQANEGRVCKVKGRVARYWVLRGDGREWDSRNVIADVRKYPTIKLNVED